MKPDHPELSLSSTACVGLGSNQEPAKNIPAAIRALRQSLQIVAVSSAWESPAVGPPAPNFVNAAILIETSLSKPELIARLKQVENDLGRVRGDRTSNVAIDIDLLVFEEVLERPDLWELPYRAASVAELLPDLSDPTTAEPLHQASARHLSTGRIWSLPDMILEPNQGAATTADAINLSWAPTHGDHR